jgi:hypothetical protein
VLVENELGWIRFVLEQWDYYLKRHGAKREGPAIKKLPSEYFHNQIYTTFFNDAVGGHMPSWWVKKIVCGPTTSRTGIRPGPILVTLSPAS